MRILAGSSRPHAAPPHPGEAAPQRPPAASWAFAALMVARAALAVAGAWQGLPGHSFWFWLPASYTAVNYGAVSAVVALSTGVSWFAAWHANFGSRYQQISNAALFSIGLMIALLWTLAGPLGTVIASVPLLLSWVSYRHFENQREAAKQRAA